MVKLLAAHADVRYIVPSRRFLTGITRDSWYFVDLSKSGDKRLFDSLLLQVTETRTHEHAKGFAYLSHDPGLHFP